MAKTLENTIFYSPFSCHISYLPYIKYKPPYCENSQISPHCGINLKFRILSSNSGSDGIRLLWFSSSVQLFEHHSSQPKGLELKRQFTAPQIFYRLMVEQTKIKANITAIQKEKEKDRKNRAVRVSGHFKSTRVHVASSGIRIQS